MSINNWFSKAVMKTAYCARVVYSYLLYVFLYTFFFKKEYMDLFQIIPKFRERYPNAKDPKEFDKIMGNLNWLPEKRKGALDFTYLNYKFFMSEIFAKKWGRDCDDFANQWYDFYSRNAPANTKVYKVLLTTWSWRYLFPKSHFIVIIQEGIRMTICDNNIKFSGLIGKDVSSVMSGYAENRAGRGKGYETTAWCVGKSNT